jgi:hypothetical protein
VKVHLTVVIHVQNAGNTHEGAQEHSHQFKSSTTYNTNERYTRTQRTYGVGVDARDPFVCVAERNAGLEFVDDFVVFVVFVVFVFVFVDVAGVIPFALAPKAAFDIDAAVVDDTAAAAGDESFVASKPPNLAPPTTPTPTPSTSSRVSKVSTPPPPPPPPPPLSSRGCCMPVYARNEANETISCRSDENDSYTSDATNSPSRNGFASASTVNVFEWCIRKPVRINSA